ncbi:MAG: Tol-Pal system beta propeller repeat protein TolB [Desulfobacteraceae bacterium]|nr:Tol-Pal system beta propeller repeat protein TolB [Desulfobacteraceae bacterium]
MIRILRPCFIVTVFFVAVLLAALPGNCKPSYDYINISEPFTNKIPMAVPVFKTLSEGATEDGAAKNSADIMQDALAYTGYFKMIDRRAFLVDPEKQGIVPGEINFKNWRDVGAELLITGGLRTKAEVLQMEFRLFDPFREEMLLGKRYTGNVADQRRMVLKFCGEVIKRLTGKSGLFQSSIAFIGDRGEGRAVYVCDFDGNNLTRITKPQEIVVSPAWSPDGRFIAYTAYLNEHPNIYVYDFSSGMQEIFAAYEGINLTPTWRPDQPGMAATLSFEGDEEIYLLTGTGKIDKRLTKSWGVDVSPTFSPDGDQMAFVSNRSGSPQIYVMDLKSGRVSRLTYEGDYNTQPEWSPVADKIVYSGMKDGKADIYVIDVETRETSRLTRQAGSNEAPSWSPDGSMIVFSSTRTGSSRLYVMTASGTDQRQLLDMPGIQKLPAWSPARQQ